MIVYPVSDKDEIVARLGTVLLSILSLAGIAVLGALAAAS